MKKMKFLVIVCFVTALSLSLSSCIGFGSFLGRYGDDSVSRDELEDILDDYYKPGDSYDITVNQGSQNSLAAARHAVLSAVSVLVTHETGTALGAGVIIKLDKEKGNAYIVTNYHVVYDSSSKTNGGIGKDISVLLYGQEYADYIIPATYVGGAKTYDLAVLKVEGSSVIRSSNAIAAKLASSDDISILDTAIAIGNPKGEGISATVGHISVDSETISISIETGKTIDLRVIRMDTPVNVGNSGGGLFNDKGEVIGIVNARHASSGVADIGYAIPSNVVKYVTDSILYYCDGITERSIYRCMLGVTVQQQSAYTEYDEETGKILKREKVGIINVASGSLSHGKLMVGDELVSVKIDGVEYEVVRNHSIVEAMLNARVGSLVETVVKRGGELVTVRIEITESALTKVE